MTIVDLSEIRCSNQKSGKPRTGERPVRVLVFVLLLARAPLALAQTWTWDGGGADNNWTTANNWNPNSVPTNGLSTSLIFGGGTRLLPMVNVAYQVNGLAFDNTAANFNIMGTGLTIGSGGVTNNDNSTQTLTVPLTLAASQTWRCTNSGALAVNATIAGAGHALTINPGGTFGSFIEVLGAISGTGTSLTKQGSNLLRLYGANSYTGATRIEAGSIFLFGNERLSNASDLVIDGGQLDMGSNGATETVDLFSLVSGDISGTGGNPVETLVASAFDVRDGEIGVMLAGPGMLTKTGAGTVSLSVGNTYSGGTTVSAGVLLLPNSEALRNTADVVINGGSLDMGSNGETETIDGLTLISGAINGGSTNTLIATALDVRSGQIDVALGGPAALTKTTAGTVRLSRTNSYAGGTTVSDGVLQLADSGTTTGSGPVVVGSAGVLQGQGTIPGSLNGAGRVQPGEPLGTLTLNNSLVLQSSSQIDIEIGGSGAGQFDVLDVSGSAALAGALNVTLVNGFVPPAGQQFLVLSYASRTGDFATINLPGPGGCFTAIIGPTGVLLVAGSSDDCNSNNTPDCADIASAASVDCNTNFRPDPCDLTQPALRSESVQADGPIPDDDPAGVTSVLSFGTDKRIITDLNVQLWIEHSWQGDLAVMLEHAGMARELLYRPGLCRSATGPGYDTFDFGIDSVQCLTLDDSAMVDIDCYAGPLPFGINYYLGPARPTQPLAGFNGQILGADWTLTAADLAPDDIGLLRFWRLDAIVVSADCNANGVPDECDQPFGGGDCQPDGIADECQLAGNDCNTNVTPDDCDIAGGAVDCQPDGVPDMCQLGPNDCNTNQTPDDCEADCNTNNTPDACDISAMSDADCNTNSSPDSCDLTLPVARSAALSTSQMIPDNDPAGVTDTLMFTAEQRMITDLNVQLLIVHDWQGDLAVTLEHGGVARQLMLRPGRCGMSSGLGYGSLDFGLNPAQMLVLDDGAPVAIDCYAGPVPTGIDNYQGPARPTQPLAGFNGQGITGDWALTTADLDASFTGQLLLWRLQAITVCTDCNTNSVPDECETDCNANFVLDLCEPALHRADMNCDCIVDAADIAPLVQAMLDPAGYAAAYPNCTILRADTQPDALVDGDDLQELVNMLIP